MKVRKFEELKPLWDKMAGFTSGDYIEGRNEYVLSMIVRVTHCVRELLYPGCKQTYDACIDEYGDMSVDEDEIMEEVNPLFSNIIDDVLRWFKESPFWDLSYGIYGTDGNFEDGGDEVSTPEEMAAISVCSLGDEEITEESALYRFMRNEYEDWEEYGSMSGPGYVIIVSYLYPYFKKLKEVSKKEDEELISYLDKAFSVISEWMFQGEGFDCCTSMAGYFLCQGGNLYDDGYGSHCQDYGVCDYMYQILIAGEMVESILFELDERYHVLPEEFKKEELS